MNYWDYDLELKNKYFDTIVSFVNGTDMELDLTRSGLAPYHLWKILEELGYAEEDIDSNGWEQDFWIVMKKPNCDDITISACGMTQEISLTRD